MRGRVGWVGGEEATRGRKASTFRSRELRTDCAHDGPDVRKVNHFSLSEMKIHLFRKGNWFLSSV